jgi:hypothetical protein
MDHVVRVTAKARTLRTSVLVREAQVRYLDNAGPVSFRHQESPVLCPSHHCRQLRNTAVMARSCGISSDSTQ